MTIIKFVISIFLLANLSSFAQMSSGQSLDKIVAVVGKEIILKSEVDGSIAQMQQQNPKVNFNDAKLREQILERLISEKLIITRALEDSIEVTDDDVNQRWNEVLSRMINQFGSEKRVEEVVGKSLSRLKYEYLDQIRKRLLSDKLIGTKFQTLAVTPTEVQEFYKIYKDSLEFIPDRVTLHHIVKFVSTSKNAKEEVYNLAKRVRDSIINGGDFGEFAKRYSGDYMSAKDNGNLGWFDKGKLVKEFEKAAFALQKGETSLPIETPFGFHIIQTLDKKPEAISTRHILFKLGQSNDDKDKTIAELKTISEKFKAGANFEELAKEYSDEKESKGFGGFIGTLSLADFPQDVRIAIEKINVGEISEPLIYGNDPSKQGYQLFWKKEIIKEHKPTLELDYKLLEINATNYKRNNEIQKYIAELKNEIYWELK